MGNNNNNIQQTNSKQAVPSLSSNQLLSMQTTKFVVFALLVCFFFVATALAQNADSDFEFNQNHFNGIKNAVREGSRGSGSGSSSSRGGGRDIDVDIDIKHLKIEFEKNFFILI